MIPKLSVIIPVYNRESMIVDCISSVRQQSLREFEILCIDDGSTDETAAVIAGIAQADSRIRLLQQENQGPGAARNRGILAAKGEYIAFLDSDDHFAEPDILERLYTIGKMRSLPVCGGRILWERCGRLTSAEFFSHIDYNLPDEGKWIPVQQYQCDLGFYAFIYQNEFLRRHDLFFPDYGEYEDPVFFLDALEQAGGFWFIPVPVLIVHVWPHAAKRRYDEIEHIIDGIAHNLRISVRKGYQQLYESLWDRLNSDYRKPILEELSPRVLERLLQIHSINEEYEGPRDFYLLDEIRSASKSSLRFGLSNRCRIPLKLKMQLAQVGENSVRRYFASRAIREIVAYGLGAYGNALYTLAPRFGIKIVGLIDRDVQLFDDRKVNAPEDAIPHCDAIVVTPFYYEDIVSALREQTDTEVLAFQEIIDELESQTKMQQ